LTLTRDMAHLLTVLILAL